MGDGVLSRSVESTVEFSGGFHLRKRRSLLGDDIEKKTR